MRNGPLDIFGGRGVCHRDGSQSTARGETDPDWLSAHCFTDEAEKPK